MPGGGGGGRDTSDWKAAEGGDEGGAGLCMKVGVMGALQRMRAPSNRCWLTLVCVCRLCVPSRAPFV